MATAVSTAATWSSQIVALGRTYGSWCFSCRCSSSQLALAPAGKRLCAGDRTATPRFEPPAYWIQSPQCSAFCAARISETQQPYFPVTPERLAEVTASFVGGCRTIDEIIAELVQAQESQPSSCCAHTSEVPAEVQHGVTPAQFSTHYAQRKVDVPPFVKL